MEQFLTVRDSPLAAGSPVGEESVLPAGALVCSGAGDGDRPEGAPGTRWLLGGA